VECLPHPTLEVKPDEVQEHRNPARAVSPSRAAHSRRSRAYRGRLLRLDGVAGGTSLRDRQRNRMPPTGRLIRRLSKSTTISRFGVDQPFSSLPSNAVTDTGEFINPKSFPTAKYWRPLPSGKRTLSGVRGVHANSFRAPGTSRCQYAYQRKVSSMRATAKGATIPSRSLRAQDSALSRNRSFDADGVTCSVCHSIQASQYARQPGVICSPSRQLWWMKAESLSTGKFLLTRRY